MIEYDYNIELGLLFSKAVKKQLEISSHHEINGLYLYYYNRIIVNLLSYDFLDCLAEPDIIKLLTSVLVHETMHGEIFGITDQVSNKKEEHITLIMDGRKNIGD